MFKASDFLRFEADKGTGTGDATGTNSGQDDKPFATFKTEADLQAAIDNRVKERLDRAQRQADEKAKAAAEEATAKALKDNAQFKELSEKQQQALLEKETSLVQTKAQFETVTQERDRYKSVLEEHVKERRAGLPDSITVLLDKLDPVEQMAWLTKNAATLGGNGNREGVPATPRQQGNQTEAQKQKAQEKATSFYQGIF